MTMPQPLINSCFSGRGRPRTRARAAGARFLAAAVLLLGMAAGAGAQTTTFNYTGALQTYTLPAGASGVLIQAAGAGGGGGGADANGPGATGGAGATASAIYSAAGGTSLNVYVGGGGSPGFTSNFGGHTCTSSAGAAGVGAGAGGFAGGAGGQAGCPGWSGGGGGGGAASVVATTANAALLIAGGGGGGQGGSWNSISVTSQNPGFIGVLPGSAGGVGATYGNSNDGGGGGGGGGGCPGGAGGTTHADNSGTTNGSPAIFGGSCANSSLSGFLLLASSGGAGGAGQPASDSATNPGATAGSPGSILMTPLFAMTVTVFADTGSGGGTANDGVQNGSEPGLANIPVTASSGAVTIATAITNASGQAVLLLPGTAKGTTVTVVPTTPTGDLSTGGSIGNTAGTYARPALSFPFTASQSYTGVSFGLVPANTLAPNAAQSILAGGIVFYAHTFIAGSAGSVTFSTSAVAGPALPGWAEVIYLDVSCSGQYASADTLVTTSIAASGGQVICLLVKEFAPATAPANATNKITVNAAFVYSGSAAPAPLTVTRTDLTTVTGSGALQLTKRVQNVTTGGAYGTSDNALPGQTLQYQVSVVNQGSTALSTLVIDDATPAFTTFLTASCPAPASLPAGLTSCTVAVQPAAGGTGALQWTFAGTLASGAQTAVTFQVVVAP